MSENIELSYVWDHTIMKILNHYIQSKIGNMIKEWVVFNKLEDFNSLLKYTDDDFTPTGKFCYINENGEKLHRKLMKEFFNLRWYIQHLVDEYEYQYGDNEWTNPLHESNWTYRTNKQFMRYVNFTLKEMTPEQMKMKPIKPIVKVNTNEVLDTEEGESNSDEQKSTISNEEEEEFTTSEELTEDVENPNTRLLLISCSQGILSSSSFSCYPLLRLLVYMYLSQLMRTFTNYLKCIVISP